MKKKINIIVMVVLALTLAATALTMTACGSEPTVMGITLDTSSVDTVFDEGDNFDYTGLKVTATMSDETTKDIAIGDCEVSLPDMFTVGEKTVTVTYGDFNAEYTITIMHKCTQKCPVCGKCMDYECEDPVCAEKCGDVQGYETYTIEAEDSNVILHPGARGALSTTRVIDDVGVPEEVKERNSDIVYVMNFNASAGATIEYNIWADKDAKATLIVSVCKRHSSAIFTQGVAVMVNGEMHERSSFVPSTGTGGDTWADFIDINLGCIDLIGGQLNNIMLMNISADFGYNFDCIRLKTDAILGWAEDDLILADVDTSGYDGVINMAYGKDFDMADVYPELSDEFGKEFIAYGGHLGGAETVGETGKCLDGTKLNGKKIEFDFYMISKGTAYIDLSMAAPSGYTTEDLLANAKITFDGKEITKENVFIPADASFSGRAGEEGVSAPFVRVRIGADSSEYNDIIAGGHTIAVEFIGDNAPDIDKITVQPLTLGQYYTYTALTVDASGAKTDYVVGEEFSIDGVVVKAIKRDGSEETLDLEDCIIIKPTTDTMGTKTVGIYFGRLSTSYSISVAMDMGDLVQNLFEAEDTGHVTYGPGHMFGTDENETMPSVPGGHVGNLNANVGATLTFRIDGGETGGKAQLFATVCKRGVELKFTEVMSITLNGTPIESDAVVPRFDFAEWSEFEPIGIGEIELQPGENVIVFTVLSDDVGRGFDFDNIMLASENTLGWYEAT